MKLWLYCCFKIIRLNPIHFLSPQRLHPYLLSDEWVWDLLTHWCTTLKGITSAGINDPHQHLQLSELTVWSGTNISCNSYSTKEPHCGYFYRNVWSLTSKSAFICLWFYPQMFHFFVLILMLNSFLHMIFLFHIALFCDLFLIYFIVCIEG